MLIPSIDLMGGKIVQLVQGESKALEFDDFEYWIRRFASYPLVQVIDLDATKGTGSNRQHVRRFASLLPCQVGGGIRNIETAQEVLSEGARKVIVGSALFRDGSIDVAFAAALAKAVGPERLIFAIDSRAGRVATHGWRELTAFSPFNIIQELEPYCGAFLYTHIDTEGLLCGIPLDVVRQLRQSTSRALVVAGGISSLEEVQKLEGLGADAVVGMAVYTERIPT